MLNVLIALRLWAEDWACSSVCFTVTYLAVVLVVNSGKTRDGFLMHALDTSGSSLQSMTLTFKSLTYKVSKI